MKTCTPKTTLATLLAFGLAVSYTFGQKQPLEDPDPQRFARQIETFAADDEASPPKEGVTVFVGSSSIRLWDLQKSFGAIAAINRGFGGSQISDVCHFADKVVLKYKPKKVVFFCGGNDIAYGKTPERVHRDFQRFTTLLFKALPETRLVVLAIKPAPRRIQFIDNVRKANDLIRGDARKDERIVLLDGAFDLLVDDEGRIREELYIADRIHLNAEGYRLWTHLLMPYVKESVKDKATQ